jgi:7,8-dihydropterin-6-yl-methyl-4-(beta-D-ribofuranosyl)aminobenzene 5'-phosphate synthase
MLREWTLLISILRNLKRGRMKVTIVYDNEAEKSGLRADWGFSALVQAEDTSPILFDTGADSPTLLHNMSELGILPEGIGTIVISHAHGDHTGGLSGILEVNKDAEIYLPASFWGTIPGRKVIPVTSSIQISEQVFSTGELKGIEQSLALKTDKGIFVLAGCSHPGVGNIIDAASRFGKVYGIAGGFHGFRDFGRLSGLSLICPCHCTQYKSEIRQLFPKQCVRCGAGLVLDL